MAKLRLRTGIVAVLLVFVAPMVTAGAAEPLRVVASFSVIADLVSEVGGEHVSVTSLVPAGQEPHEWEPTPRDVAALAEADLVVVNGLGLEGWLDRLVAASGYSGPVIVASRDTKPILDASGAPDPHAWHSLLEAKHYLAAIADGLIRAAPRLESDFARRREEYARLLTAMGDAAKSAVSMVPQDRRVAYATHDAFAYLERDHGILVQSPAGVGGPAQASARQLAELVGRIHETGAKAVFPEAGGESRLAHVLADEAGVRVGAELYAGTLSGPEGPAPNYVDMWLRNLFLMLFAMTP
jgi:zinc/manganese transport system substrate-binding protein